MQSKYAKLSLVTTLSSSPPKRSSPTRNGSIPKVPLPQTPTMKAPQFFGIRESTNPDFSSGPENQSSPEYADNEDTPEPPKRGSQADISDNVTVQRGSKSPSKRQSFSEMFSFRRFSPGRSGFRKRPDRDVLAKKVHKRKRRELEKDDRTTYRRPSDDSGSDYASRQPPGSKTGPQEAFFPALAKIIVDHPSLPHVLAFYVQLLWNMFLCLSLMYVLYSFWAAIRQDVDVKAEESVKQTMAEMGVCASEYVQNRCDRASRVPAMETLCENWENCMNRDPHKVARARISAHTFAEIFNSFIEPITYKTMVCRKTHLTPVSAIHAKFSYYSLSSLHWSSASSPYRILASCRPKSILILQHSNLRGSLPFSMTSLDTLMRHRTRLGMNTAH